MCSAGLFCELNQNGTGTCTPQYPPGQACTSDDQCLASNATNQFVYTTYPFGRCNLTINTCEYAPVVNNGYPQDPCSSSSECIQGLSCLNNSCQPVQVEGPCEVTGTPVCAFGLYCRPLGLNTNNGTCQPVKSPVRNLFADLKAILYLMLMK